MSEPNYEQLADTYVLKWQHDLDPNYWTGLPVPPEEEALDDWIYDATRSRPEELWRFVLAVFEKDAKGEVFMILSAGPLEDLLSRHGMLFIDRVEAEAGANPRFATLLGGVWQSNMSTAIWERVVAARDRRGWDGEPAPPGHWWDAGTS